MCAEIVCYLLLVYVPTIGGHEQYSAVVESREECETLRAAWFGKWAAEDFDVKKFGRPQVGCLRTVNI